MRRNYHAIPKPKLSSNHLKQDLSFIDVQFQELNVKILVFYHGHPPKLLDLSYKCSDKTAKTSKYLKKYDQLYPKTYFKKLDIHAADKLSMPQEINKKWVPFIYKLFSNRKQRNKFTYSTKKILLHDRQLRTLKTSNEDPSLRFIARYTPYLQHLQYLSVENFPFVSRSLVSKLTVALRHVRRLNLGTSEDFPAYNEKYVSVVDLFKSLFLIPRLNSIVFNTKFRGRFNANQVPFDILAERNIVYKIRIRHTIDDLIFSEKNTLSLMKTECLCINLVNSWELVKIARNILQTECAKLQGKSSNLLHIDMVSMLNINLETVFDPFRNVSILDLTIPYKDFQIINFDGFKKLTKLKCLCIHIYTFYCADYMRSNFFENLRVCAEQNPSLSTIIFDFESIPLEKEDEENLSGFFETCKNTVTKFLLKVFNKKDDQMLKCLYKGIIKLSCLKILNIIVEDQENGAIIGLEELHNVLKSKNLDLNFANPALDQAHIQLKIPDSSCLLEFTYNYKFQNKNLITIESV